MKLPKFATSIRRTYSTWHQLRTSTQDINSGRPLRTSTQDITRQRHKEQPFLWVSRLSQNTSTASSGVDAERPASGSAAMTVAVKRLGHHALSQFAQYPRVVTIRSISTRCHNSLNIIVCMQHSGTMCAAADAMCNTTRHAATGFPERYVRQAGCICEYLQDALRVRGGMHARIDLRSAAPLSGIRDTPATGRSLADRNIK